MHARAALSLSLSLSHPYLQQPFVRFDIVQATISRRHLRAGTRARISRALARFRVQSIVLEKIGFERLFRDQTYSYCPFVRCEVLFRYLRYFANRERYRRAQRKVDTGRIQHCDSDIDPSL
jgi:hypothetical protein